MLTKKLLALVVFAFAITFATGCQQTALNGAVEAAETDAMVELRLIAEEALRTANTAAYDAASAKDSASAAQEAANAARACCDANTRRMSRMFESSMGSK